MPAITVDDILVLPRIPEPGLAEMAEPDSHLGHHRPLRP